MKASANIAKSIKENDLRSWYQYYFVMKQALFKGICGHWPGVHGEVSLETFCNLPSYSTAFISVWIICFLLKCLSNQV